MSQVSSLQFGSRILLVGETIERVEINEDASWMCFKVKDKIVITWNTAVVAQGYHIRNLDPAFEYPVLFPTEPDVCLESCKEFCFAENLW